jgi:hypothetical protein
MPFLARMSERLKPEIPSIDAHIELLWQGFRAAVTMEVDRALSHVTPCPKRVEAQHEFLSIDGRFRILLDALPEGAACNHGAVVVADDEVLPAMQRLQ